MSKNVLSEHVLNMWSDLCQRNSCLGITLIVCLPVGEVHLKHLHDLKMIDYFFNLVPNWEIATEVYHCLLKGLAFPRLLHSLGNPLSRFLGYLFHLSTEISFQWFPSQGQIVRHRGYHLLQEQEFWSPYHSNKVQVGSVSCWLRSWNLSFLCWITFAWKGLG